MDIIKTQNPNGGIRNILMFQLDISWQLLEYNLNNLGDEECLWKPSLRGLHVVDRQGVWCADWPEIETYDIGPPSIAWLTWHIIYWWSMVFEYSFGQKTLSQEAVPWPGNMRAVKEKIFMLHDEWKTVLMTLSDEHHLAF